MANTELPQPELPGVMRVTPAGVTLVVVGETTLQYMDYSYRPMMAMHKLYRPRIRLQSIVCNANRINSVNFNAMILKLTEKFYQPFSYLFIFTNILLRVMFSML